MTDPQIVITEVTLPLEVDEVLTTTVEVVEDGTTLDIVSGEELSLRLEEPRFTIDLGKPGPQGPPGPAATPSEIFTAAETLSGHRAVVIQTDGVAYADNTDAAQATSMFGVTTSAALVGTDVTVIVGGTIREPTWSWTPAIPVFVGTSGTLTQTPPTAPAFQRIIGYATSPTTLFVSVEPAIILT